MDMKAHVCRRQVGLHVNWSFTVSDLKKNGNGITFLGTFASSCCPSAWNNLTLTGWTVIKFDISVFSKICQENFKFH